MPTIPLSLLELALVPEGGNFSTAIERTVDIAKHAETLGFKRIWMAEHHNIEHIASSATSVLIGHVAGRTKGKLRIGSGGIMLPNHSPLVIAEQFGTLEAIYPGRIDLGLGRAPGTDQLTAQAIRKHNMAFEYDFKTEIQQLQSYLSSDNKTASVRAFPGEGSEPEIWILGSSTDSAFLAADMGLPYAFAAHFAPSQLSLAGEIYRERFKASSYLKQPYFMACVNVIAADSNEEAELLSSSQLNLFLGIVTNQRKALQPPGPLPDMIHHPDVRQLMQRMLSGTFVGNVDRIKPQIDRFITEHGLNELMVTCNLFDQKARYHSLDLLREAFPQE